MVDALVEHTERRLLGDGGDGSGRNELGRLIMSLRDILHAEEQR
jgi:predicted NAD-dependent protein-ADP-ribosyltransferase YbiA (DUF1768 family)